MLLSAFLISHMTFSQEFHTISLDELKDKIHGYWIGQLVGNYLGFPFENLYDEEPIPVFIDRYMNHQDAQELGLKMNIKDRRGYLDIMADAMGGAWSDDDTDIEFVTLHGLEKYGLDITYSEMAELRKKHINRFIWASNARVKELIEQGHLPPATGTKELNPYWYTLGSQLTNEIWGVIYPGIPALAAEKGEWNAKITNSEWAIHGTILFVTMYSAAFFETDIHKLLAIGMKQMPKGSPYKKAVEDVIRWHREHADWKVTRQLIHEKYYNEFDGFSIPSPILGAVVNGLNGVMALLYGDGDFTKTIGIATTTGYDCDNQAATLGGLLGVMYGGKSIPARFTHDLPSRNKWKTAFNDTYINYSRDGLLNFNKISDIIDRIIVQTEKAILSTGGKKENQDGLIKYMIPKL